MFNEAELVLVHHYSNGVEDTISLSEKMNKTRVQIYNIVNSLKKKGILSNTKGIELSTDPFAIRLMNIMHQSDSRAKLLANSGLDVLIELREPKTMKELEESLGLSKPSIYRIVRSARIAGAVVKDDDRYRINTKMWAGLTEFLDSAVDRRDVFDERIPRNSRILGRIGKNVIFSNPNDLDFNRTGFTLFGEYNFDAAFGEKYYTTVKEVPSIQDTFDSAFMIAEAQDDYRLRMLLILFYETNKKEIHPPQKFENIYNRIRTGEEILKWPTFDDIQERLEVYA